MESTQSIKRRIKAVINTAQITKAMEMVSANKMRRSQEAALASRPYALSALTLLRELSRRAPLRPPLMERREVKRTLVLIAAADKGLAGSLNSNVFRRFEKWLYGMNSEKKNALGELRFAAVGKKAENYLIRRGFGMEKAFVKFGDSIEVEEIIPIADFVISGFLESAWDKALIISTHFRTTLRQDVVMRELLPVTEETLSETMAELIPEYGKYSEKSGGPAAEKKPDYSWEYLVEPTPEKVLAKLSEHLVKMAIYHLMLEANASEHSARMVAMKNASDNASDLKNELALLYNKSRQADITREIAEITSGAEALKNN